jgi:FtsP/CotA-like multicopper oxidase with cupredoxin domain
MKMGLLGSGYMLLPHDEAFARVPARFRDDPRSPATTPFVEPLPVPDAANESIGTIPGQPPFLFRGRYIEDLSTRGRLTVGTRFFEIVAEQRTVSFHPELGQTSIWGYRPKNRPDWPFNVGPTIFELFGQDDFPDVSSGLLIRQYNDLPIDHRGFGVTRTSVHLHGGHHPAEADGFPTNLDHEGFEPFVAERGDFFDHFYPTIDPGFLDFKEGRSLEHPETTARQSTLWYHDHLLDFTGPNVYRGLAGFVIAADERDPLDETNADGLQLPSGEFDIPLVLQDKLFARDGSLVFNSFDHDGFIGDKFVINGKIQPYADVFRRKYRFRFLNGSNARIYQMFLTNGQGQKFPMTQIATEGGLLSRPIPIDNFMLAMAERVEVVIDFNDPIFAGQKVLYFENRLEQEEGRKPDGLLRRGVQLVQLRLGAVVDDPSFCGKPNPATGQIELRPFPTVSQAELNGAVRRTFEFDRRHGAWTINGRLAGHLERPAARSRRGQGEIWRLVNKSGGWWHPIHIHSELFRVIRRRGRTPPLVERDGIAKKDTILLRDNDEVEVFVKFRDYPGPFVFHCHNIEHEDLAMMARFDVVD